MSIELYSIEQNNQFSQIMEKDSDSTITSLDENTEHLCDNPTRDTLAEGIVSLFQPVIDQLDDRVRSTR